MPISGNFNRWQRELSSREDVCDGGGVDQLLVQ